MPAPEPLPRQARKAVKKEEQLQIRATSDQKHLITSAAEASGQSLSTFMLETSVRRAQEIMEHERFTFLTPEGAQAFDAAMDAAAPMPAGLDRLKAVMQLIDSE